MRDFPVFTTEYGVASLTLREVPYTARAYVVLRSSVQPELLLKECKEFCVAVGAKEIYASGDSILEAFPFHTSILKLQCLQASLGDTDAALWPVTEETAECWRTMYNEKSVRIPNGAWLSQRDLKDILKTDQAYFVHRGECLLGTGLISGGEIRWVCSMQFGAGEEVVRALAHAVTEEHITVEVASENHKAMELYKRLGFIAVSELSKWYKIL